MNNYSKEYIFSIIITPVIITLVGIFSSKIQKIIESYVNIIITYFNNETKYFITHKECISNGNKVIIQNNNFNIEAIEYFLNKTIDFEKIKNIDILHQYDNSIISSNERAKKQLRIFKPLNMFNYDNMKFCINYDKDKKDSEILNSKTVSIITKKHTKEYINNFINKYIFLSVNLTIKFYK